MKIVFMGTPDFAVPSLQGLHIGVHRKQLLLAFLILNKIPAAFCKNQNSNTYAGCRQYFSFHKDLFSLAYSVGVLPVIFLKEIPK